MPLPVAKNCLMQKRKGSGVPKKLKPAKVKKTAPKRKAATMKAEPPKRDPYRPRSTDSAA